MEDNVRERFEAAGVAPDRISATPTTCIFTYDGSPAELLDLFRQYYGPTTNAHAAAKSAGRRGELHSELRTLCEQQNQSGADNAVIHVTFLEVIVQA